jgi:hypothetical protein
MHHFQVMKKWGAPNKIDFLSLSYTRHAEDVRQVSDSGYYRDTFGVYFKVPYFLDSFHLHLS